MIQLQVGFVNVEYSADPDHLLTPVNGEGRKEKATAEKYFRTNFSDFNPTRSTRYGMYGWVMVTAKQEKTSILQPQIWAEVRQIGIKPFDFVIEPVLLNCSR